MVNFCLPLSTFCLLFILLSPVWIRIRIRKTDPDPQSSYLSDLDPDPRAEDRDGGPADVCEGGSHHTTA